MKKKNKHFLKSLKKWAGAISQLTVQKNLIKYLTRCVLQCICPNNILRNYCGCAQLNTAADYVEAKLYRWLFAVNITEIFRTGVSKKGPGWVLSNIKLFRMSVTLKTFLPSVSALRISQSDNLGFSAVWRLMASVWMWVKIENSQDLHSC